VDILLALRNDDSFAEVRLEPATKKELSLQYRTLHDRFIGEDTEIHDYAPAFRPDEDGILRLKYDLPTQLSACCQALPGGIRALDADALAGGVKALVGINVGRKPVFYFQAIDNRVTIQPRRMILFYDRTFRLNDTAGIVFADRLDAIHQDGFLYFRSEVVVRRFLDVEEHFTTATNADLEKLFGSATFAVSDIGAVKDVANTVARRKLHGILQSGRVLDSKSIQAVARKIGVPVQLAKGRIVVPTSLREFRDFVRILDDAYLASMLDSTTVYLTTSKRQLKSPVK
jgi:hypothetical protein